MRVLRWFKRIVLALLALGVIAVIAIVIALHTDWGRNFLRRRIEAALQLRFPGGARIGRLEGSVFGELTLRDVEIDGDDHVPELTIGTATMKLDLLPLLHKTARFEELEVSDVMMIRKPSPAGDPSTWTIKVRDFAVHRARVTQNQVEVDDIDAAGTISIAPGGELAAMIEARARYRDEALTVTAIVGTEGGTVTLPLAVVEGAGARAIAVGMRAIPGTSIEGRLDVDLPLAASRRLTGLDLGYDLTFALDALGDTIDARATIGEHRVRALLHPDLAASTSRGLIIGDITNIAVLTSGAMTGDVTVVAAVDAHLDRVRGVVSIGGPAAAAVAFDLAWTGGRVVVGGGNRDGTVAAFADITRANHVITFDRSRLVAHVAARGDLIGTFDARLEAKGAVWPRQSTDLHVAGTVAGSHVRYASLAAGAVDVRITDLHHTIDATTGGGHLEITGASRAGRPLGSASLDVRASRKLDGPVIIALGDHRVRAGDGSTWTGTGGEVVLDHDRITLARLQTTSGNGQITARGSYATPTGDLTATIDARAVALLGGKVDATGTLTRRAERWSGSGTLRGRGLVVAADLAPLDGNADVRIAGRRITIHGLASSSIGSATIAIDLDGPSNLVDPKGWLALDRRAIRELGITVAHLDTGRGIVDGDLVLGAKDVRGALALRGAHVGRVAIDGDVTFGHGDGDEVAITGTARVAGVGAATGEVHVALPVRIFDPAAWRARGASVLRDGSIRIEDTRFDPAVLAKLGIRAPYSGRVAGTVTVAPAGTSATFAGDVRELHGGAIAKPIDLHLQGGIDAHDAHVALTARLKDAILIELTARSPLSVDQIRAGTLRSAPIAGTIAIPAVSGRQLLSIFDRTNVVDGTVTALVEVGGTIAAPTGHGTFTARDVTVPATVTRAPSTLKDLVVDVTWDGAAFDVVATGHEATGGMVHATGKGVDLTTAAISIDTTKFDLAPIAAFAPTPWSSIVGIVDSSLAVHGLDPRAGDARGELHLREGSIPIASKVGMLRHASADITVADHRLIGTLRGKLGDGDVTAHGTVTLDGAAPTAAEATLTLRRVSPIGGVEPVIDADITAKLTRSSSQWSGTATVRNAHIVIPPARNDPLFEPGAPIDMTFVDEAPRPNVPFEQRPPPSIPTIVVDVDVGSTIVESDEVTTTVSGQITLSAAKGAIGADGEIDTERGVAELFGRRYQLDHGALLFDGTLDPLLNIRLVHDFPDVTLTADVSGRASNPDLVLTSDPAKYTQGQLLGFFLGGEPGGDPGSEAREAATNAGSSVVSGRLGKRLNRVLPVKIDVLNYEAGTSVSSAAIRAGKWVSAKLFLAYRQHLSARPDENGGEGDAEYYLRQNLLIQGTAGDRGYDGVDLLWRKRW